MDSSSGGTFSSTFNTQPILNTKKGRLSTRTQTEFLHISSKQSPPNVLSDEPHSSSCMNEYYEPSHCIPGSCNKDHSTLTLYSGFTILHTALSSLPFLKTYLSIYLYYDEQLMIEFIKSFIIVS